MVYTVEAKTVQTGAVRTLIEALRSILVEMSLLFDKDGNIASGKLLSTVYYDGPGGRKARWSEVTYEEGHSKFSKVKEYGTDGMTHERDIEHEHAQDGGESAVPSRTPRSVLCGQNF